MGLWGSHGRRAWPSECARAKQWQCHVELRPGNGRLAAPYPAEFGVSHTPADLGVSHAPSHAHGLFGKRERERVCVLGRERNKHTRGPMLTVLVSLQGVSVTVGCPASPAEDVGPANVVKSHDPHQPATNDPAAAGPSAWPIATATARESACRPAAATATTAAESRARRLIAEPVLERR